MKLFADDVKLYIVHLFKDHLVTFKWWLTGWQLGLMRSGNWKYNDKSSLHRITNRVDMEDCNPSHKIGDHVLRWSDETRDLGVIVDKNWIFTATSQPLSTKLMFEHHWCSDHLLLEISLFWLKHLLPMLVVGGWCSFPSEICAQSNPPPSKNADFDTFPLITSQP